MKIMGHRGARKEAPENTLLGIETALRAGVEGIEIDVHLSSDGQLVVIHDDTVDRTTDGTGAVAALPLADLRALDAGRGERIPTLEEVLEAVRGKATLFVEVKAPGCEEPVVETLARLDMQGEASLVKSFHHRWMKRVKELAPAVRTGCLLYGLPVDPAGLVRAAGADLLSVSVALTDAELVRQCHAGGVEVCAWNCNSPEELPRFRAMGVDWLGSDRPTLLLGS